MLHLAMIIAAAVSMTAPTAVANPKDDSSVAGPIAITVYKTPTCGCCGAWVEHLEANGFTAEVHNRRDLTPIKMQAGLPPELASCHTAMVGGYAIEGHVPAADIKRLLEQQPDGRGLAVPGMPMGSPGMEGPRSDRYDTLLYTETGATRVFQHHPAN